MFNFRQHIYTQHEDRGKEILLERQGTIWEGSCKNKLPAWMTTPEKETSKAATVRHNLFASAGRLLAVILSMKS